MLCVAASHGLIACGNLSQVGFAWLGNEAWLPRMDSNHDKQIQNLQCYRYTTRQQKHCYINRPLRFFNRQGSFAGERLASACYGVPIWE